MSETFDWLSMDIRDYVIFNDSDEDKFSVYRITEPNRIVYVHSFKTFKEVEKFIESKYEVE